MTAIQSVVKARTNAELIEYIAPLYIPDDAYVLDATYGKGKWWSKFEPARLRKNDIDPEADTLWHYDFRQFPEAWADLYDVVAYDPPYIAQGGRTTSTLHNTQKDGMLDRYGLHDVPTTHGALRHFTREGAAECLRVLRPGGVLLWKTMDYINSGCYQSGLRDALIFLNAPDTAELVDIFVHHSGTGPQPLTNRDGTPRRQVHSRRAHSYLLVGRKK